MNDLDQVLSMKMPFRVIHALKIQVFLFYLSLTLYRFQYDANVKYSRRQLPLCELLQDIHRFEFASSIQNY